MGDKKATCSEMKTALSILHRLDTGGNYNMARDMPIAMTIDYLRGRVESPVLDLIPPDDNMSKFNSLFLHRAKIYVPSTHEKYGMETDRRVYRCDKIPYFGVLWCHWYNNRGILANANIHSGGGRPYKHYKLIAVIHRDKVVKIKWDE